MDDSNEQNIELQPINIETRFGSVAVVEKDDTLKATGYVGDRALAFRKPDTTGTTITTSTPLGPLGEGFYVWTTDAEGNDIDGGIGVPDNDVDEGDDFFDDDF